MTVKWDMQQKHGSPPRVMKKSSSYFDGNIMTPVHFTALSMVDISYFADANHHCQRAASEQMDEESVMVFLLREKWEESAGKWSVRLGGQH